MLTFTIKYTSYKTSVFMNLLLREWVRFCHHWTRLCEPCTYSSASGFQSGTYVQNCGNCVLTPQQVGSNLAPLDKSVETEHCCIDLFVYNSPDSCENCLQSGYQCTNAYLQIQIEK